MILSKQLRNKMIFIIIFETTNFCTRLMSKISSTAVFNRIKCCPLYIIHVLSSFWKNKCLYGIQCSYFSYICSKSPQVMRLRWLCGCASADNELCMEYKKTFRPLCFNAFRVKISILHSLFLLFSFLLECFSFEYFFLFFLN